MRGGRVDGGRQREIKEESGCCSNVKCPGRITVRGKLRYAGTLLWADALMRSSVCVCVCVWSDSITQLQPQRPASSLWWSNSECDARFCWLDATIQDLNLHSSPNRGVCCLEDKYNTPLVSQKNTQTLSTAIRNFLRHDLCNYVVQEGKWGSKENRSFQSDVFQSPVWKMKLLIFF